MAICNLYMAFNGLMLSCLKSGLGWANFGDDGLFLMVFLTFFKDA